MDSEGANSEGEIEKGEEPHGPLMLLSEAAAMFIEATFGAKLDNAMRVSKAKKYRKGPFKTGICSC